MRLLLHVHSRFSYDGRRTLSELRNWARQRRLDGLLLTEHADDFSPEKMQRFVADCDALSDHSFRLVPGLELTVDGRFHLLGYGLRVFRPVAAWDDALDLVQRNRGLAVLAHPARYRSAPIPDAVLARLDGIEVWNAGYDGRFVPSGSVLAAAARAKAMNPGLKMFGGQDLHDITTVRLVETRVDATPDDEAITEALRVGAGEFGAGGVSLRMNRAPGLGWRTLFRMVHGLYTTLKRTRAALVPSAR